LVAADKESSDPKRDTCEGDSGGPIYAGLTSVVGLLAGVTSRQIGVPGSQCGDGGNYGLIDDRVVAWMHENGVNPVVRH